MAVVKEQRYRNAFTQHFTGLLVLVRAISGGGPVVPAPPFKIRSCLASQLLHASNTLLKQI